MLGTDVIRLLWQAAVIESGSALDGGVGSAVWPPQHQASRSIGQAAGSIRRSAVFGAP